MAEKFKSGDMDLDLNLNIDQKKVSRAAELSETIGQIEERLDNLGKRTADGGWTSEFEKNLELINLIVPQLQEMNKELSDLKLNARELETLQKSLDSRKFNPFVPETKKAVSNNVPTGPKTTVEIMTDKGATLTYAEVDNIKKTVQALKKFSEIKADEVMLLPENQKNAYQKTKALQNAGLESGKKYTPEYLQKIFESYALDPLADKLARKIETKAKDATKGYVGASGFQSFFDSNGNFIPSTSRISDGGVVPKNTWRVYSNRLRNMGDYGNLSGKSLTSLAKTYQELLESGTEQSKVLLKTLTSAVQEAITNTEGPGTNALMQKFNQLVPDTQDFANVGAFWDGIRALFNYTKDFSLDNDTWGMYDRSQEEVEKDKVKQAKKEADAEVKTEFTGAKTQSEKMFEELTEYYKSPAFVSDLLSSITAGTNVKDLVQDILGNARDQIYGDKSSDHISLNTFYDGKAENKKEEAINAYDKIFDVLFNQLNEVLNAVDGETKNQVQEAIDIMQKRKDAQARGYQGNIDTKVTANRLSNLASFGGVVTGSINKFASDTGMDETEALKEAIYYMDNETRSKLADSIDIKKKLDELLDKTYNDFKSNLESSNLDKSKNTALADWSKMMQQMSPEDFFSNLENLQAIQEQYSKELEEGTAGKFWQSKKKVVELIQNTINNLRQGLTVNTTSTFQDFNDIITDVKEFSKDVKVFVDFMQKFYTETYGVGKRSINYNEEAAKRSATQGQMPRYTGSSSWDQRTPKQRNLGATVGLDVTASYGASDLDTATVNIEQRIKDTEAKIAEAERMRKEAQDYIDNVEKEIQENQELMKSLAEIYPSKTTKAGGITIDWASARGALEYQDFDQAQVDRDRKSFNKAQDRVSRLRESTGYQEAQQQLQEYSTQSVQAYQKAIERMKDDLDYIVKLKKYLAGETENLKDQVNETTATANVNKDASKQESERQKASKDNISEIKEEVKEGAQEALKAIDKDPDVGIGENEIPKFPNEYDPSEQNKTQEVATGNIRVVDGAIKMDNSTIQIENGTLTANIDNATLDVKGGTVNTGQGSTVVGGTDSTGKKIYNYKAKDVVPLAVDYYKTDNGHYYTKKGTNERVTSITSYRDALLRKSDPMFAQTVDAIKNAMKDAAEGMVLQASDLGMDEKDFDFYGKGVVAKGIRGDIVHSAIDALAKSGITDNNKLLENFREILSNNENFQKVLSQGMSDLSKLGLDDDNFVRLFDNVESYINAISKAGLSLTKLSEIPLGFTIKGEDGRDVNVAGTADQFMNYGIVDNKLDAMKGYESIQLTLQKLMLLANKDLPELQKLFDGVDLDNGLPLFIANIKDGMTELVQFSEISLQDIYNLVLRAQDIMNDVQGAEPLNDEEKRQIRNNQYRFGKIQGTASTAESVNEELMFIDADQGKVIKDYLSYLKQINDVQLKIVKAQNDMETADENSKQNIQELLDSYNKQLETLKANQPQLESFVGSEGLQYRLGQNLLDSEHADYLKKKLDEVNNAFESKSIESINKIKANLEKLTSKDTPINTGLFGEDFDIIVQKIKDGYTEIDRTQESLTAKIKAYEASLRSEVSALKDIATHSTKIQSIIEQIDKLQADNSTENSELLNDLNKRLKKEQELLKVAEQRRDVAIQERQGTGLDEDIASGKVDAQTKQRIANAYSQQRQNLVNAVNQGTAKAEADQSVQNYVQANKLIKEYINNLKLQYKTQQEIQKLSIKMENQSGNELAASEAYKAALESRIDNLQEQLPYYDQQSKKLGNIKLEEEQIVSLEKQKNNLAKQQQIAQEKINATVKDQRSLLQEIVGGFKQAFRNMTDASIAYEIIGMIRQGITELLQTIREMDSALVDLQIASGGTREEMHDMMMDLNGLATEVGKTTTEVAQGANDWLRAGYEGQEAADLTRASMQLSTLGMIDSADATSYLISVLKGWKLEAEEVSQVVDKLVSVDMAAALSAGDLAEAIKVLGNSCLKHSPLYRAIIQ